MSSPNNQDKELAEFFTDVEYLRDAFKNSVAAPTLTKRLLVIHGVGGVGKSSLLRMFRLHCKSVNVPVALASGDDSKSALDVLTHWTEDLKADGVALPSFGKTFEHYREIQAKVDGETQKARGKMADLASKAVGKTAETAAAAAAGAALGSIIPGIGTIAGAIGGMGAEALVDWLRGFLTKPDIDLLLDPTKKLTDDFLTDVALVADKRRIVLMLDTFEQMTALDDWARDVAQQLHANVFLVIAGRAMVNWGWAWPSWLGQAQVEELKPMTKRVMHELVQRYYRYATGGKEPDHKQIEAIIEFSHGLPMFINTAVHQWVFYQGDFQSAKPKVMEDVVKRLREGMPRELYSILDAAAVVRWFNTEILCAVTDQADVSVAYQELQRFPFVRSRVEGLALHDAVRDILGENLRLENPARHRELHERAAAYFEKWLEKVTGEEAERLGLERLYHRVRADEEAGIKLFQEMAEELVRYRLVNRLRALLNDANTYPLERENSRLWREYYNARLAHWAGKPVEAEKVYQAIGENINAEPKLQAYALHDWGVTIRGRWIKRSEIVEQSIFCFERSLATRILDRKVAFGLTELGMIYRDKGEWDKALEYLNRGLIFYRDHGSPYDLALVYSRLRWYYTYRGDWRQMFTMRNEGLRIANELGNPPFLQKELALSPAALWAGRWSEVEQSERQAIQSLKELGLFTEWSTGNLAADVGACGKFNESIPYFLKALEGERQVRNYSPRGEAVTLGYYGDVLLRKGDLDTAIEALSQSATTKRSIQDTSYLLETINLLGVAHEILQRWSDAEKLYNENLTEYRWTGRLYFICGALTGLIRVKHTQGDYAAIPLLLAEAEQLAQQYEYNDHLASLRLTQGMTTDLMGLNGQTPAASDSSVQSNPSVVIGLGALDYFKQAMIYALRYNRFLLDEVLSGRPHGTPLRPIIPYCLERGEEGRQMLIALRDWWKTGVNDIGTPRPDTISPIPEGIALLEAERIAREREPGDGSPQKSVVEQIEIVL